MKRADYPDGRVAFEFDTREERERFQLAVHPAMEATCDALVESLLKAASQARIDRESAWQAVYDVLPEEHRSRHLVYDHVTKKIVVQEKRLKEEEKAE